MAESGRPTILIVDDEENIRDAIAFNMQREGFDVLIASDGNEGVDLAKKHKPDVVVLDIMLPGIDGLEVLRRIRTESHVPVLMLSAKGDEIDRVVGLEIGADDYITKPFAMRELLARVRAIVRRVEMSRLPVTVPEVEPVADVPNPNLMQAGSIAIDLAQRVVTDSRRQIDLNPKEFDLLVYFARHPGVVMTREALLREVWGYEYRVDTRTVDVHIRWLRLKFEESPASPKKFITVRGSGYKFVPMPVGSTA